MAAVAEEDSDASLATFREVARRLEIWLHIGSLAIKATKEHAANRAFVIDPKGEIVARYDKIHMFDVDLAGGESYRESRSYRAGEHAVPADLPWGRLGLSICYDLRFPALYRALAEAGASFLAHSHRHSRGPDRRGTLARSDARPRRREWRHWRSPPRKAASTKNGHVKLRPFDRGRSLGPRGGRGGHRTRRDLLPDIDPAEVAVARGRIPRCSTADALK